MRRLMLGVTCGMALLVLAAGCTGPREEPLPEPLKGAWLWGQVGFGGSVGDLYADQPYPRVAYTQIWLYFPGHAPGDPSSSQLTINLHLEDAFEPLPGSGLPDSSIVLGAPVSTNLTFDRFHYLYSGIIVPYAAGEWTLEFAWNGPQINARAYLPLTLDLGETRRAVTPIGSIEDMVVLAWIKPPKPIAGQQLYEMLAWHSRANTHTFFLDSTLTVLLTFPELQFPGEPPDTSVARWEGGRYIGTLSFPNVTTWNVRASVMRDSLAVGVGLFLLD